MAYRTIDFQSGITDADASDGVVVVDGLRFTVTAPGNWTLNFNNGRLNFAEDPNFAGSQFRIEITSVTGGALQANDFIINYQSNPEVVNGWLPFLTFSGTSTTTIYDADFSSNTNYNGEWSYKHQVPGNSMPGTGIATKLVITDNPADVSSPNPYSSFWIDNLFVDTDFPPPATAPVVVSVSSPDANKGYKAGDVITVTVTFDQAVVVSTAGGTPTLLLETGSTDRTALYMSGSGSNTLTFAYTVQPGDTSADLDYTASNAFQLNGATIKLAGDSLNASLTLPTPGAAGSLGANKAIAIDTTPPVVSITSNVAFLKAGQTATITFTFSEDPGGSFTLADATVSGGTLSGLSGTGTVRTAVFTPNANIDNGTASITVAAGSYADTAGNLGGAGATPSITFDTLAPTVTISSDRPVLKAGEIATITFTFSEDPGSTFTWDGSSGDIVVSGGTLSAISGSGTTRTATFTPNADMDNGMATIAVPAGAYADQAGNVNGAYASLSVAFDTKAPAAPAVPDLAHGSDSGASNTDNLTNATTTTFGGAAGSVEGGATVTLYDSLGNAIGSTTALGDGSWSVTSTVLPEGTHTITARATDAAGNTSPVSASLIVTIDRTAPTTSVASAAFSHDSGSSSSDFVTNTAMQTISGNLSGAIQAGDSVLVSLDNGNTWVRADHVPGDTSWVLTGVVLTGSNTLQVKLEDAAGNSGPAFKQAYVLDTSAPATTPSGVTFSADTGASSTDLVTNIAAQTISGTLSADLQAGDIVYVSLDNGATWTAAQTTSPRDWSLAGQTLTGSDTLIVKVTDQAGNDSSTLEKPYVLNTVPPSTALSGLALSADTGASNSDFVTRVAAQTVAATLASALAGGESLYGSLDGGHTWTDITAMVSGTTVLWTGVTLTAGSNALQFKVVDVAGNDGPITSQSYTLDMDSPAAPVLSLASDSGLAGDGLTNSGAVTVAGLENGASWQYSADNGHSWTTGTGTTLTLIGEGAHEVQVRQTDAAGNVSLVSDALSFTLDNLPPTVSIALSSTHLAVGESAVVTFTFSEAPLGFSGDDVTVQNGTLSNLTVSATDPRVYTATLTPNVSQISAHNLITVGTGWSDAAGNAPLGAAASVPYSIDTRLTDGVAVVETPVTYPDGTPARQLTIPVVTAGRNESDGMPGYADIPLVTVGGRTALLAQLPVGYGLLVTGPSAPKTAGSSLTDLIHEITQRSPSGSADQGQLIGGGSGFLGGLAGDTPLIVQAIAPTVAPGSLSVPGQPLVISGAPALAGNPMTALVIDGSGLPSGTHLQLDNVDFAVVIGAMRLTGGAGSQVVFADSANQHIVLGADDDTIHGGAGDDYVGSHGGDDWLYGDAGNDTVSGGEGHDRLFGGDGHDWLYGGTGHDRLDGGTGHDSLYGGTGHDTLLGGTGNDVLKGEAGHDRLVGGFGRDKMWGGAGKDVFVFTSIKDSKVGAQRDVIYDFQSGRDTIDLRGIDANEGRKGNQAFTWTSKELPFLFWHESGAFLQAGFTGKAGQLRYEHGLLMGDVNGDGRADFQIKIVGKFAFSDVLL